MNKAAAQRIHAKRRALQRYGLLLNRKDLKEITALIQNNKGTFVESKTLRITIWLIEFHGKIQKVVYDKNRKQIVSFLPNPDK